MFEDPIKILFTLARDEFEAAPELPVQARRRPDSIVGDIIRSRTVVPRADVLSESVDARLRGAPPATAAPTPHPLD